MTEGSWVLYLPIGYLFYLLVNFPTSWERRSKESITYLLFHGSNTDNNRGQKRATE